MHRMSNDRKKERNWLEIREQLHMWERNHLEHTIPFESLILRRIEFTSLYVTVGGKFGQASILRGFGFGFGCERVRAVGF
jgi:hypothetical protein